jgi:hypothetical protein
VAQAEMSLSHHPQKALVTLDGALRAWPASRPMTYRVECSRSFYWLLDFVPK